MFTMNFLPYLTYVIQKKTAIVETISLVIELQNI
jgi:hypothetical protein